MSWIALNLLLTNHKTSKLYYKSILLLNSEVKMMNKAILQSQTTLDVLTAAQGGTCAIINTECCVCIPENSAVCPLHYIIYVHKSVQYQTPITSLNDLLGGWFLKQPGGRKFLFFWLEYCALELFYVV